MYQHTPYKKKVGKLVAGRTITLYQFQQQDLVIPPRVTSINLCSASWKLGIIYYPQANMTGQRNSIRFEENNLLSKEFIPFYINTLIKLYALTKSSFHKGRE